MLDERDRFKIPVKTEAYLDFEIVDGDKFAIHRQYGRFQEIDFIGSDFTGYAIRYYFKAKAYQKSFQLYLGGALKRKFFTYIIGLRLILYCSFFFIPSIEPLKYTFSRPVSSGCMPAPNSINGETRPETLILPWVGLITPAINLRMVDLPEPFGPIMPTVSPGKISKVISLRAVKRLTVFSPIKSAGKNSLKVF